MIKKIFLLLLAMILPVLVIGPFLPNTWQAKGEYTYEASAQQLHSIIGNLETWSSWEPWMSNDSKAIFKKGQNTGVGAKVEWTSESAKGQIIFTMVNPAEGLDYDFIFEGFPPAKSSFRYSTKEMKTRVVWTMNGAADVPVIGGYLAYIVQGMISENLKDGLGNIDKILKKNK